MGLLNKPNLIYVIILSICLVCACVPIDRNYCEDYAQACTEMLNTLPYESPIDTDWFNEIVLFADGTLVTGSRSHTPVIYALKDACSADTVCDILFFDENLDYRNYSYAHGIEFPLDQFIIAVTPTKCCKMDTYDNVTLEFGNDGPDSTMLINAVHADINYLRQIFVVDAGDSTIKVYDHNGIFIARWTNIGDPYRIKVFNGLVQLLDRSDDSIKRYSFEGEYFDTRIDGSRFDNTLAFLPIDNNDYWIADMNGERLTYIFNGVPDYEIHSDFCYWGVTFYIGRIVAFDGSRISRAVDMDGNYILTFGGYYGI